MTSPPKRDERDEASEYEVSEDRWHCDNCETEWNGRGDCPMCSVDRYAARVRADQRERDAVLCDNEVTSQFAATMSENDGTRVARKLADKIRREGK